MDLSNLRPAVGATNVKRRLGRGVGSGLGGHSSTRGTKGQNSISGGGVPVWFEGGQMPLQRRLPKFGFKNRNRVEYRAVNLSRLQQLVESGVLDASQPVTPETLVQVSVARKGERVKVLGGGELSHRLQVHAHAFSESARQRIEAAGGSVTVI